MIQALGPEWPDQEAFIASPPGQETMAQAIFSGVEAYFRGGRF